MCKDIRDPVRDDASARNAGRYRRTDGTDCLASPLPEIFSWRRHVCRGSSLLERLVDRPKWQFRRTRAQSCDCAPSICFCAPHICNVEAERQPARGIAAITRTRLKDRSTDYYQNWHIQTAGFPNGVSIFIVDASPARKPQRLKSPPPRPRPSAHISSEHHDALARFPNDTLDYTRDFPTDRPLAVCLGRANLEMVEALARICMWKGDAAAQRWRAAG
jgi:hypothetical protein